MASFLKGTGTTQIPEEGLGTAVPIAWVTGGGVLTRALGKTTWEVFHGLGLGRLLARRWVPSGWGWPRGAGIAGFGL